MLPPPNTSVNPTLSVLLKFKKCHLVWLNNFQNFPRLHRASLGRTINELYLDILSLLFTLCYMVKEQKILQLAKIIKQLDLLKFFVQLSWEAKLVENKKFNELSEGLAEAGRMLGGLQKKLNNPQQ